MSRGEYASRYGRENNILVLLRMSQEFIQYLREIYPKLSGQNFNGTLV